MRLLLAALAVCATALSPVIVPAPAGSQAIVSTGQSFISGRLLPGKRLQDGVRMAGLRLQMAPGWKTYWRAPGAAGIPPQFDWSASENVANIEVLWPRPEVFMSFGMKTIGYGGVVVLPVRVAPADPTAPVELRLAAEVGVCREICVLEEVTAGESIPADLRPIAWAQVRRALRQVPVPASDVGVYLAACRITGQGAQRTLEASVTADRPLGAPEVLVEGSDMLWVRDSRSRVADGQLEVSADLVLPNAASWVDRSAVRLTVLGEGFAADIQGCIVAPG